MNDAGEHMVDRCHSPSRVADRQRLAAELQRAAGDTGREERVVCMSVWFTLHILLSKMGEEYLLLLFECLHSVPVGADGGRGHHGHQGHAAPSGLGEFIGETFGWRLRQTAVECGWCCICVLEYCNLF